MASKAMNYLYLVDRLLAQLVSFVKSTFQRGEVTPDSRKARETPRNKNMCLSPPAKHAPSQSKRATSSVLKGITH